MIEVATAPWAHYLGDAAAWIAAAVRIAITVAARGASAREQDQTCIRKKYSANQF